MARRGRFTNPNAGGQNLSSLIVSLLRERKNAEEQLLLEKFRNKEVSAEEVQAFYDNWASTSGFTEGTLEFDQLNQRKKNAYDTGIKYRYDDLLADFNATGGKNYTELMSFLNGDAQTVNDKNNAQQYLDLRKNVTNNFINEASNQLQMGQMTIDEFRTQVDAGIDSSFTKGSKEYNDAKYSAFVAEYNGEYTKYQNRIKANKSGAYSGYMNFLNQMRSRMASEKISGELLTRIEADMVSVRAAGAVAGANPQIDRYNKSQGVLAELYAAALSTSGVRGKDLTAEDLKLGKTYTVEDMIANPGAFETWVSMLEDGTAQISPELAAKYDIDSPGEIRDLLDKEVKSIQVSAAAANRLNPTQANANAAALGTSLARTIGSQTQIDDLNVAMNKYGEDIYVYGLAEDDIALRRSLKEWNKFLSGQDSIYGKISKEKLDEELAGYGAYGDTFKVAIANSLKGSSGKVISIDDQTLEGMYNMYSGYDSNGGIPFNRTYADGSVGETDINYNGLTSGQKVQVVTRDPNTGLVKKVTTDPLAVGATGKLGATQIVNKGGGYLSVLTYVEGQDGAKVPIIQSIAPNRTIIVPSAGTATTTWGYEYTLSSGKTWWISTNGDSYDQNPFKSLKLTENGVYSAENGADAGVMPTTAPVSDIDSFTMDAGNSYVKLRQLAVELTKLSEDPNWVNALGVVDQDKVSTEIQTLTEKADRLELTELNTNLFRASERGASKSELDLIKSRISDVESPGTLQGDNYRRFVLKNPDKYRETSPGVFTRVLPADADFSPRGVLGGANEEVDPATGLKLPDVIDIRPIADVNKVGERANAAPPPGGPTGLLLGQGFFGNAAGPFFRNAPTTPQTSQSYLGIAGYTGGVPSAPKPTALTPIVSAAMTPFNANDREARRALIAAETQTTAPKPVTPIRIGGR
jgi:hypothetical protein